MSINEYYDHYWSEHGFRPLGRISSPLQMLYEQHIAADSVCLDVGCGDAGTSGPWLTDHTARYVGVDVSEPAVSMARAAGFDVRLISDATSLPFADGSFDVVTCIEVFEHLFAPDRAAAEIARVLRADGLLIATVPNIAYWRRRVELAMFGRWNPFGDDLSVKQSWRDPHIRFFTASSLRRMLGASGLSPLIVGGFGGSLLREFPGLRRVVPNRQGVAYARLERFAPSLLATRLYTVATKRMDA